MPKYMSVTLNTLWTNKIAW